MITTYLVVMSVLIERKNMDHGEKILKEVLTDIENMTIDEYNKIYERDIGDKNELLKKTN